MSGALPKVKEDCYISPSETRGEVVKKTGTELAGLVLTSLSATSQPSLQLSGAKAIVKNVLYAATTGALTCSQNTGKTLDEKYKWAASRLVVSLSALGNNVQYQLQYFQAPNYRNPTLTQMKNVIHKDTNNIKKLTICNKRKVELETLNHNLAAKLTASENSNKSAATLDTAVKLSNTLVVGLIPKIDDLVKAAAQTVEQASCSDKPNDQAPPLANPLSFDERRVFLERLLPIC